jgi:methylglutaconyl-CoA hydratase
MADGTLQLEVDARGVATLTMNRPEMHNAFDEAMIALLAGKLDGLAERQGVRVIVLAAQGKSFSAGADLNYMKRAAAFTREENVNDALALGRMLLKLRTMAVPTIAAVQGAAYGGGVGLVAACDIAVATEAASFGLTETRLGLIPSMISPFVIAAIGAQQARRYFQTAERFSAAEARRIGLLQEVVPDEGALEARVGAVVDQILATGPEAVAHAKKLVLDVGGQLIDEALLRDLAGRIADRRASDEGIEGITAFLERRRPRWAPG